MPIFKNRNEILTLHSFEARHYNPPKVYRLNFLELYMSLRGEEEFSQDPLPSTTRVWGRAWVAHLKTILGREG